MAYVDTRAPSVGLLARTPSPALVVSGIASVQTGSALAATLFGRIGPGGAVLLRLLSASIVLAVLWRPWRRPTTGSELALAALFGLVLATMNLAFYHAIARIPLGVGVTIEFVGPLAVGVAGSRKPLDVLWVVLAAGGIVALMHGGGHGLDALGVVLALVAGASWGLYILVNARLGRVFHDGSGLALAMCTGAALCLPVGLGEGGTALLAPHSLVLGAAVGMLSSAIPYSFEMEALRRLSTGVFGVLMSLEPAMAALAGFVVLGQALSPRELAGIGLVVAASVGASRRAGRTAVAAEA